MKKYLCIIMAAMAVLAMATGAFAVVYGKAGYENQGYSEATAWEIDSAAVLAKVRDDVNSGKVNYAAYYKLTKDIDLTDYQNWTPIGAKTASVYNGPQDIVNFKGHFDGDGHTIKVNISSLITDRQRIYHGLFGVIYNGATIKNLTVSGNVEYYMRSSTIAELYVGGIAAFLVNGSIENCNFDGTVIANNLSEHSYKTYAGGIVARAGYSYYTCSIKNCKVGSRSDTSIQVYTNEKYGTAGGIAGL